MKCCGELCSLRNIKEENLIHIHAYVAIDVECILYTDLQINEEISKNTQDEMS